MEKKKSIVLNTRYSNLIVIQELPKKGYNTLCLCLCDCGKTREVMLTRLNDGSVRSCGCKNFISKKHKNSKFKPEEASFRAKASNYKALAKKRNIVFELTMEETCVLLRGNCYYCNKGPSNFYNARLLNRFNKKNINNYAYNNPEDYNIYYNGIDRVDNTFGYIKNNVVSCCTQCNTAKLASTQEDFKQWIIKVYNNFIIK